MQYLINKEIRYYEEEIFLGLNLRQLLCSGVAIAVAVVVYLLLEPLAGRLQAGSALWRPRRWPLPGSSFTMT